jgi:hypothetical protein
VGFNAMRAKGPFPNCNSHSFAVGRTRFLFGYRIGGVTAVDMTGETQCQRIGQRIHRRKFIRETFADPSLYITKMGVHGAYGLVFQRAEMPMAFSGLKID